MQSKIDPRIDAAMRAAEAFACSLKTIKPDRALGQYGAVLRRVALIEAHGSMRAMEDPASSGPDAARMAVAARFMCAHARLIDSGNKFKLSQARLDLANEGVRAMRRERLSHEEQPHGRHRPRRPRDEDYPLLSDAEIDEILRNKALRSQDPGA